jgi:hypothetical protein
MNADRRSSEIRIRFQSRVVQLALRAAGANRFFARLRLLRNYRPGAEPVRPGCRQRGSRYRRDSKRFSESMSICVHSGLILLF